MPIVIFPNYYQWTRDPKRFYFDPTDDQSRQQALKRVKDYRRSNRRLSLIYSDMIDDDL